jgi:thiosulfate/3-mercaptopyruvate sulfurtransferase
MVPLADCGGAMSWTTLIGAAELARHLQDPDWIVLDCRSELTSPQAGRQAFDAGHIPTAQYVELDVDMSDKSPGPHGEFRGRHPLPARDAFIATLRRLGVHPHSQVVAYDAQGSMFAARLWWMLHWVGHEAVAVLDGGLPAWTELGHPLSTDAPARPAGSIVAKPSLYKTVEAADLLAPSPRVIIDARAPDRFRGENETLDPVGGHIPGARNRFFKDNLDASGRFKPAAELRSQFSALLPSPEHAVMQCGSGVTACHNLLAMEVAGLRGAALYPGSWSEWCADPERPIATGAA